MHTQRDFKVNWMEIVYNFFRPAVVVDTKREIVYSVCFVHCVLYSYSVSGASERLLLLSLHVFVFAVYAYTVHYWTYICVVLFISFPLSIYVYLSFYCRYAFVCITPLHISLFVYIAQRWLDLRVVSVCTQHMCVARMEKKHPWNGLAFERLRPLFVFHVNVCVCVRICACMFASVVLCLMIYSYMFYRIRSLANSLSWCTQLCCLWHALQSASPARASANFMFWMELDSCFCSTGNFVFESKWWVRTKQTVAF